MKAVSRILQKVGIPSILLICLLLCYFLEAPAYADKETDDFEGSSSSSDVHISVETKYDKNHRYACDVIFFNMRFKYKLQSIAHNSETNETYVNNGSWILDENVMNDVPLTVVNHAEIPMKVTAKVDVTDFTNCDITVDRTEGMENESLPACKLEKDGVTINESSIQLTLKGYPNLYKYKGNKTLSVVIQISPESGYMTNGEYFEYPSK